MDGDNLPTDAAGAVFGLTSPAPRDETVVVDGGTVSLRAGRSTLAVAGAGGRDHRESVDAAVDVAERALDLLCYRRGVALAVPDPYDEHIAWLPSAAGVHMVLTTLAPLSAAVSATAEVHDAHGRRKPSAPRPATQWDASLRYFRASQLAATLNDSYRSLWLAVESLLDVVLPYTTGGESTWVKDAFAAAGVAGIDVLRGVPRRAVTPNAAKAAYRYFYDSRRNLLFHSKRSRGSLSRRSEAQHRDLEEALAALAVLYADLGQQITGEHRQTSGMTYVGFDNIGDGIEAAGATMFLLDEEPQPDDIAFTLGARAAASGMAQAPAPEREPGFVTYTASDLRPTAPFQIVAVTAGHRQAVAARFLGRVDASDVSRVDVRLRHRLSNAGTRDRFAH
jgi:hypothetical protein